MTEEQEFEAFKKFSEMYFAHIEKTGKKYETFHPSITHLLHSGIMPTEPIVKTLQDEIAIYMMEPEYDRFMHDWSQYIDVLYMVKNNPIVKAEFEKLVIMIELLK